MSKRKRNLVALLALAAFASACTAAPKTPTARPIPPVLSTSSPTPTAALRPVANPVSLLALTQKHFDGRGFKVGRVIRTNGAYTRYFVTYRSGDLRISGIMNVPAGKGPFPVLIFNHGHIEPAVYRNGQGLGREQDYLARHGYVIVHTDYRNHAQSDDDPTNELKLRIGYTEDVVNAVLAIRAAKLPYIDLERIGMLGRSMGGGITYNALVVVPDLVKAAVVYAPVSSDYADNFNRWILPQEQLAGRILDAYGSPKDNPAFWRGVSAVNYFDRIAVPLLIHHGTADERCPIEWTRRTVAALEKAGVDVTLYTYPGEHHEFAPQWLTSIKRTRAFFDARLKA
jgi:dipeptidyl aminopeptidase/acylaminoacyl peptidase